MINYSLMIDRKTLKAVSSAEVCNDKGGRDAINHASRSVRLKLS